MEGQSGPHSWPIKLNPKGRIVLPAEARREAGWDIDAELVLWRTDTGFEIVPKDLFVTRIQRYFVEKLGPDRDLVQELIEQRQAEAIHEERDS